MKKRYLLLVIVIATALLPLGCSNKKNVALASDKVIIDEDTKKTSTENGQVKFDLVAETEAVERGLALDIIGENGDIIQPNNQDGKVSSLRIGTVSDKKNSDNRNKMIWKDVDLGGAYNNIFPWESENYTRLRKDNKVYTLDKNGYLEEIEVYTDLIKKYGDRIIIDQSSRRGTIDVAEVGSGEDAQMVVVDTVNNKYYTITMPSDVYAAEAFIHDILGIDGDKIYITRTKDFNTGLPTVETTIGYLEKDKFTKVLSSDDGIKIDTAGEALYENGRILFSGLAEGKNGIWNYDVESKKLKKLVDVESNTFFQFFINDTKDKVIMSGVNFNMEDLKDSNYTLSIANINDKLEISNITNIATSKEERKNKLFAGWAENGTKFYIESIVEDENYHATSNYEIYKLAE